MNDTVIIENPCYHCYMGSIGECIRCKYYGKSWIGDFDSKKIEVDETEVPHNDECKKEEKFL